MINFFFFLINRKTHLKDRGKHARKREFQNKMKSVGVGNYKGIKLPQQERQTEIQESSNKRKR